MENRGIVCPCRPDLSSNAQPRMIRSDQYPLVHLQKGIPFQAPQNMAGGAGPQYMSGGIGV